MTIPKQPNMKKVKAVQPYIYPGQLNFKNKPFEAWIDVLTAGDAITSKRGKRGDVAVDGYYSKWLRGVLFKCDVFSYLQYINPLRFLDSQSAHLLFVQPQTLYFDASISVLSHEVIPFVWDCWPQFFEKMAKWMERNNVRTAIFTCKETARLMQERFPNRNIMYCPEGVDSKNYKCEKRLIDRNIDMLEFGRPLFKYVKDDETLFNETCSRINHVRTGALKIRPTDKELYEMMSDAKVTICYPHCVTEPDWCGGIETLTQRYWECMLSGILIIGHTPKELIDLIGYNPCVEVDFSADVLALKMNEVLNNISSYQTLIDKNRKIAKRMSDWTLRMKGVQNWLESCGYKISH